MKLILIRYYTSDSRSRAWTKVLFAILDSLKIKYCDDKKKHIISLCENDFNDALPFIRYCPVGDVFVKRLINDGVHANCEL